MVCRMATLYAVSPEGFAARTIAFAGGTAALDGGNEPCHDIPKERERERGGEM